MQKIMVPLEVGMKTSVEVRNGFFLSIQITKTTLTWTSVESIKIAKMINCI
jgi:hypothetical protein